MRSPKGIALDLIPNNRTICTDKMIAQDVSNDNSQNILFTRLVAKKRSFSNIDFKYTIFNSCYIRDCVFNSCDFTGCQFLGSNFYGSTFVGCKFDYAIFEKTIIDNTILDECCPSWENLKLKFARSLRVNYAQLGDSESVNKAINIELKATKSHLYKAWNSNESYYRMKYRNISRLNMFIKWITFILLDIMWGNGEKIGNLFKSLFFFFLIMTVVDLTIHNTYLDIRISNIIPHNASIFFGNQNPR